SILTSPSSSSSLYLHDALPILIGLRDRRPLVLAPVAANERSQIDQTRPYTGHLPVHGTNAHTFTTLIDQHIRCIEFAVYESCRKRIQFGNDFAKTGNQPLNQSAMLRRRIIGLNFFSSVDRRPE